MKRWLGAAGFALACTANTPPQSPVIVPVSGHVVAVVDRWRPSCPAPRPIYSRTWDSTLADTLVVFASPFDPDTIAGLLGVTRNSEGEYSYHSEGSGGDGWDSYRDKGVDSVRVGPWLVIAGEYNRMVYAEDIDIPEDSSGRVSPEHWRQSWFYAFAPTPGECAVVLAWRSPAIGSYRGPRYFDSEIDPDSLRAFIGRVRWRLK
jgi:hypothetical protein